MADLAPGEQIVCTGTYTITQADLDAGSVLNTACVDDGEGGADEACDDDDVPGRPEPRHRLDKTGTFEAGPVTASPSPARRISYAFAVTNTGNVTLTDVTVTDPLPGLSAVTCVPAQGSTPDPRCHDCTTCTAHLRGHPGRHRRRAGPQPRASSRARTPTTRTSTDDDDETVPLPQTP